MHPKRSLAKTPKTAKLAAQIRKKPSIKTSKKQAAATKSKFELAETSTYTSDFPANSLPNSTTAIQLQSSKQKKAPKASRERSLKRAKSVLRNTQPDSEAPRSPPPLNEAPTQPLSIFPFSNGENCELSLRPNTTEALTPYVNPYFDASSRSSSKPRVVQVAYGGMHTVVLTSDNKIVTWGVNDN
ncbi:hypothetical protein ARSEF4850_009045 [Beauveria asiatica]